MSTKKTEPKSLTIKFPEKIDQFNFALELEEFGKDSSFRFALYRDKQGKEYICKLYQGNRNRLKYKWIKNEIVAYRTLNKNTRAILNKSNYDISIPKIYGVSETAEVVYFVMDKVTGHSLNNESIDIIIESYQALAEYLTEYSKDIDLDKTSILRRNFLQYFVLYHYYCFRVILKYPGLITTVFKTIPVFYNGIFRMGLDKTNSLVIRDLASDNNIFLDKKKLSIIDLESATITNPIVQLSSFVVVESSTENFLSHLCQSKLITPIMEDYKKLALFKAMLIYGALVDVVATYRSDKDVVKDASVKLINSSIKLK